MGHFINSEILLMLYSNLKTLTMITRTSHAINTLLYYCINAVNGTSNKYVYCTIKHGRV